MIRILLLLLMPLGINLYKLEQLIIGTDQEMLNGVYKIILCDFNFPFKIDENGRSSVIE